MPIHQKINRVMQAVVGVEKTSTNKVKGGYKYAGHEAVNAALRGKFAELGIVRAAQAENLVIHEGGTVSMLARVTYTDIEDGSSLSLTMPAIQPSQTTKGTVEAQQIGQCLSYAVKNIEFKLFALTGDDEPDSDSTHAGEPLEGQRAAHARLRRWDCAAEPEEAPQVSQGAKDRAGELLTMLTRAASAEEVTEVNNMFKAEWRDIGNVPGLRERMVEVRTAALKRLGAS